MSTQLRASLEGYYTQREVSTVTGLSRQGIWKWVRDGKIEAERVGREVLIRKVDVQRVMAQRERIGDG